MLVNIEKYIRLLKYLKEDKANGKTGIHLVKNDFPELYLHTAKVDSVEYKTIKVGLPHSTMGGDYIPQEILKKYYIKSIYSYNEYVLNYEKGWENVELNLDIPIKQYSISCILARVKQITGEYRAKTQKYIRNHKKSIRNSKRMITTYQKNIELLNQTE